MCFYLCFLEKHGLAEAHAFSETCDFLCKTFSTEREKSVNDMDFLYKMKNRLSDMDSLGQEPKRMSKHVLSLGCVQITCCCSHPPNQGCFSTSWQ